MATTYDKISSTTLGSEASTISLSSIPATYTDLRIVFVPIKKSAAANFAPYLRLNDLSTGIYSYTVIDDVGYAVNNSRSTTASSWQISSDSNTTTTPELITIDLFSYAGSTFKSALITTNRDLNGSSAGAFSIYAALCQTTNAITSIDFIDAYGSGGFGVGTTLSIYGIKAA
jgi:hypothetical protein